MNLEERLRDVGFRSRKQLRRNGLRGLADFARVGFLRQSYKWCVHPMIDRLGNDRFLSRSGLRAYAERAGGIVETNLNESVPLDRANTDRIRVTPTDEAVGDAIEFEITDEFGKPCPTPPPYFTDVDTNVYECPNARIAGSVPIGLTESGQLVHDTVFHTRVNNSRLRLSLSGTFENEFLCGLRNVFFPADDLQAATLECATLLTTLWGGNFGHWMSEDIYKLRYVERYAELTGTMPTLVVESNPPDWKVEYLETLGYGDQFVEWGGGRMEIETLVVPPFPHPTPQGRQWLRRKVPDGEPNRATDRRIFISRQETPKRRLVANFEAVREVLEDFDFEWYVLEDMPVVEQADLFREADVVCGVHGAGFANTMYSERPTLIEILDDKVYPGAAWTFVAATAGWDHHRLWYPRRDDGIHVDVDELERTIESALSA